MLRDFRTRVLLRVLLLAVTLSIFIFTVWRPEMIFASILLGIIIILELSDLFRFTSQTNRKLTRFLESIRYSDFISGFTADNRLGKSFRNLNKAFNEVLEAFRKARSEKEEHWQYLNTVVQQVHTGILSFDTEGHIELINTVAKRFMHVQTLQNIHQLADKDPNLYHLVLNAEPGTSRLYKGPNNLQLSIQASEMRIRGHSVKLVTMQNIQPELQRQEIDAWQNLTRVLRHEIMNSITPISSITSTLKDVLDHDLIRKNGSFEIKMEGAEDLKEGLDTIDNRSRGLIKFIDAYREYTSLPLPTIRTIRLSEIIDKVSQLMKHDMKKARVSFTSSCTSEYLTIQADYEMIEQVLINLVKNAVEAVSAEAEPKVELNALYDDTSVIIEVVDNGPGIIPEALEQIFIPFYTTKKGGSGIGLSLSRQIMQMHNGTLTAESEVGARTIFRLRF